MTIVDFTSSDGEEERSFATQEEALEWMERHVDDHCIDNRRFAYLNDEAALDKYQRARDEGCCGIFDTIIEVNGQRAKIGCNYGH